MYELLKIISYVFSGSWGLSTGFYSGKAYDRTSRAIADLNNAKQQLTEETNEIDKEIYWNNLFGTALVTAGGPSLFATCMGLEPDDSMASMFVGLVSGMIARRAGMWYSQRSRNSQEINSEEIERVRSLYDEIERCSEIGDENKVSIYRMAAESFVNELIAYKSGPETLRFLAEQDSRLDVITSAQ